MMRSLHLFNALLALVAIALGTAAVRIVADRGPALVVAPPVTALRPTAAAGSEAATLGSGAPDSATGLAHESDVLLMRHPFGKPLPVAAKLPDPPRVIPPPEPLPTLIGTLSVGNESRALLKDGSRTDLFVVGDSVAGGTLVEIHTDRVVIKRGETLGEVSLKTSVREMPATLQSTQGSLDSAPPTLQSAPTNDPAEPIAPRRQRVARQRPPVPQPPATEQR